MFGNILRLRNILSAFDRFAGKEILSPIDFQDYTGTYHDVYEEIKPKTGDKDSIMDDVVFEMELVKQVEVNIDYILMLVAKYHDDNCKDKEVLVAIDKAIKSSLQLRSKWIIVNKSDRLYKESEKYLLFGVYFIVMDTYCVSPFFNIDPIC